MVHWYVALWILPIFFVVPLTLHWLNRKRKSAFLFRGEQFSVSSSPKKNQADRVEYPRSGSDELSDPLDSDSDFDHPILCADTDLSGFSTLSESLLDNGIYPNCLSDQVDDILIFSFPQNIDSGKVSSFLVQFSDSYHLSAFYWHHLSGTWQPCRSTFETKKLVLSFQISDRHSSLSEKSLMEIRKRSQEFSSQHHGQLSVDPVHSVIKKIDHLNGLIDCVDAVVALNVVPRKVNFPGTKIRSLAEAFACYYDHDQGFFRRLADGVEQFRLTPLDGSSFDLEIMRRLSFSGVSLSFYLPHVFHPSDSFNQMVSVARRFSQSLEGDLVDDEHRLLSEQHLDSIRKMMDEWVLEMKRCNLNPGDPISLRVFSENVLLEA